MSDPGGRSGPRRTLGLAALGVGAASAAVAAGWAAQRRVVSRSSATAEEISKAGLDLPDDVEHSEVQVDDGGRIHVISRGKGQPLVLLHGVFLNSGLWVNQLAALSDEHRVIAIDLRGHGGSILGIDGFGCDAPIPGPPLTPVPNASVLTSAVPSAMAETDDVSGTVPRTEDPVGDLLEGAPSSNGSKRRPAGGMPEALPVSLPRSSVQGASRRRSSRLLRLRRPAPTALERLARDVRQVLSALEVEHGILVGHSMGGMVAISTVAGMSPQERHRRLSGLVLTSTTTGPMLGLPGWDLFASVGSAAALRVVGASVRAGRGPIPRGDISWWASRIGFGADASAAQVRFVEAMLAQADPRTMSGLLEALARVNLTGLLPALDLPTLVTVGTRDRLTPPWHSRRLEARLPEARLVELARCGHMPMLERPREFDRLLEEHARKVS